MDITVNFMRPGKGVHRYTDGLVDDNPVRIKTLSHLTPEFSLRWCEQNWWLNGHIPRGILVSSVVKYLFYREWFSVMQLVGTDVDHLGYYVDIDTPMRKVRGEYYLTDLFLDLWIFPDGTYIELDRDEFEESYQSRLITQYQYRKANQVIEMLKGRITNGNLFNLLD